ncbi:lantibiotic dehydratase [Streptomyces sp. NPDC094448]|uniref:lantibiotic dehydratase n=1 Tax=Streptomyces sp. NPDC094448 TaxID=3366063 RepID=UPI0037F5F6A2
MPDHNSPPLLGSTALVRIAGVPCALWTAAGNPRLSDRLADHADDADRRAARARRLAVALGEIVPDPRLADAERHALLALRRRLHSGAAPRPGECGMLTRLPAVPWPLAREAGELLRDARAAAAARSALEREVAGERERVGALAWRLLDESPVLRAFVDTASPGLTADIARILAEGEGWTGKRLRKRSGYLWRAVARSAVKTTPRGWACHIAAVPVVDGPAGSNGPPAAPSARLAGDHGPGATPLPFGASARLLPPGAAVGALAATAAENVHLLRTRLTAADPWQTDPATPFAPAALHVTDPEGRLRCYGVDPADPARTRQVAVRRTPVLDTILGLLAAGPRTLPDLERAVAGPAGAPALHRLLDHLVRLGVLQPCAAPRRRTGSWVPARDLRRPGTLPHPARTGRTDDWFVDSYRTLDATVPEAAADRVRHALGVAARVDRLRRADLAAAPGHGAAARAAADAIGEEPRPLGALLADLLGSDGSPPAALTTLYRYTGWHPAHDPASGYARLLAHLDRHRDDTTVDIGHTLLDTLGAPPAADSLPPWPLDCLLRPLPGPAGPVAVLETASAAHILDARFAEALHTLHGPLETTGGYRAFLAAVERRSGTRFVELLLPPAGERAANAVRRPVTTRWWTGDPNHAAYCPPGGPPQRYLPLDRITLRRTPGAGLVAEADGVRLLPVHHATRVPLPPYDLLAGLLLRAGHPAASTALRLDGFAAACPGTPETVRTPRLTAGGDLVIAPATWRIPRDRFRPARDGDFTRARALAALARAEQLPRCVLLRPSTGGKPLPVDLTSPIALTLVERLCATVPGDDLLFEEMLPEPDRLPLRDAAHHGAAVAGQLLLTLAPTRDPDELAALAAAALTPGVPGPRTPCATATGTVTTP